MGGFKTEMPGWSRTMTPDVYRHLAQHWGRKGFPYKANNRVQDQKREYYPNDDTLLLRCIFSP